MFSLVLIDDEYWALRGIRDYIDWESYGFRISAASTAPRQLWSTS